MYSFSVQQYRIALYLGVLFSSLFFLISPHFISGSNDGAYVAMVRNWQKGRLYCNAETFAYLGDVSFAQVGNKHLPDRNIGVTLLTYPLQLLLYPASELMNISYRAPDVEQKLAGALDDGEDVYPIRSFLGVVLHLIPALFGGLSVSLLYVLFNQRQPAPHLNVLLATSFAIGTCFLPFSLVLFNHIISVFLVLFSLALFYGHKDYSVPAPRYYYVLLGACLGFMSLIDYTLIIYGVGMMLILAIDRQYWGADSALRYKNFKAFVVAGGICVALYMLYNTIALGRPWRTPYSMHGFYLYAHSLSGLLSGNWFEGLKGLFFAPERNGLFVRSPVVLFGFLTIAYAIKKRDYKICSLFAIIVVHWFFSAKLLEWHGGGVYPRYILWSTMILAVLSGFWLLDVYFSKILPKWQRLASLLIFALCAVFSMYNSIAHFSYPGRSKQIVFLLEPSWNDALQKIGVYGTSDVLLLVWLFVAIFMAYHIVTAHYQRREYLTTKMFWIGGLVVLCLPAFYAMQNPWVRKDRPLVLFNKLCAKGEECDYTTIVDNYSEGLGQARPDGYMMPYENITLAGSVMFPTLDNKPAFIRYNLQPLQHKERKQLKVDFTLTSSTTNYIAIRVIYADGKVNTLFQRHSDTIEKRYMAMLELRNIPDYNNIAYIELEMFVDDKAVTNADARIHAMAIY